ncbi:MAG: RimK family alpha-L-glutamate ligase [Peptoniphilus sp.]|nr:RimK family alpha-L-glutamate ligase [Peptoniphilus sp.]MDY6045158.1 RimK family alpha-L-glutamate ligase [Peptoniphilus sp.]
MLHIIYHGYFSFNIHHVVRDLLEKSDDALAKPHTDYALEYREGHIVATDLKGDAAPDAVLFFDKDILLAKAMAKDALVLNNPRAIALADDKIATWEMLASEVPMIDTIPGPFHYRASTPTDTYLDYLEARFGYPMVVKAAKGSFGEQVFLAKDRDELVEQIEAMGNVDYLVQRFISESAGVDKRVLIVGDAVVGAIERRNDRDFRANLAAGSTAKPISLTREEARIALKAHRAMGLDFSGIDLIDSKAGPLVIEVNSNMGYLGFQEATGIDVSRLILDHLSRRLKAHM